MWNSLIKKDARALMSSERELYVTAKFLTKVNYLNESVLFL